MATIKDLISRLKKLKEKTLQDQEGWFRGGRFTPIQHIKEYFTQPEYQGGRSFWSTPIARGLASVQRGIERATTLPRISLPRPQVKGTIPKIAVELGYGYPESLVNIPRSYLVGITRIGREIGEARREKRKVRITPIVSGTAALTESLIDVGTMGLTAPAKQIFKRGGKWATQTALKTAIKRGAVSGAKWGALGGLTYGLDVQYGKKFSPSEVAKSTAGGAVLGGVVGGALGGTGALFKKLAAAYRNVGASKKQAESLAKTHFVSPLKDKLVKAKTTKAQRKLWAKINKELGRPLDTPVYHSDLKRAINKRLGLPDTEVGDNKTKRKSKNQTTRRTTN